MPSFPVFRRGEEKMPDRRLAAVRKRSPRSSPELTRHERAATIDPRLTRAWIILVTAEDFSMFVFDNTQFQSGTLGTPICPSHQKNFFRANDVISMLVHLLSFSCGLSSVEAAYYGLLLFILSSKSVLMTYKNLADTSSRNV